MFVKINSIITSYAQDWEYFTYQGNEYLIVANAQSDAVVYLLPSFSNTTQPNTFGVLDWTLFAGYLVASNFSTIQLYQFNGNIESSPQTIPANGVVSSSFFTIGQNTYLACAETTTGSSR